MLGDLWSLVLVSLAMKLINCVANLHFDLLDSLLLGPLVEVLVIEDLFSELIGLLLDLVLSFALSVRLLRLLLDYPIDFLN